MCAVLPGSKSNYSRSDTVEATDNQLEQTRSESVVTDFALVAVEPQSVVARLENKRTFEYYVMLFSQFLHYTPTHVKKYKICQNHLSSPRSLRYDWNIICISNERIIRLPLAK